jgi:hypothetical protein
MFKPNVQQMTTTIRIQHRNAENVNGEEDVSYISETDINFCNWKSKGGTESIESGSIVVYDTAELILWYAPNISEQDRVLLNDDEKFAYEITNVENIELRNMFLILKVKRVVSA